MMTFEHFQYAFANTLPLDEQRAAYDRYVVPESRGVPTSSLGAAGKVDFHRPRRPLLITAGEKDYIIPASLNRSTQIFLFVLIHRIGVIRILLSITKGN